MAPRIFFRSALVCPHCGTLNEARGIELSTSLGNDPEWTDAEPGEVIDVSPAELEDPFIPLRAPEGSEITAIELWSCQACRLLSPAFLRFRARTPHVLQFLGADVIRRLTNDVIDAANYLTRRIEEWNPLEGEDEARIEELKRHP